MFVAKYDFVATESDALSFKKGDLFYVINSKENWWYINAKHSGEEGYVPSNYLKKCVSLDAYE